MIRWYAIQLPFWCVMTAALELDVTRAGQWTVSRPLVLGPLLGWACGTLRHGTTVGVLIDLLCLDRIPAGRALPPNGTIAVAAAVLLAVGPHPVEPALGLPAALAMGWGFSRFERSLRRRAAGLTRRAERALEAGGGAPFGEMLLRGLAMQVLAAAAFLYVGLIGLAPALSWAWSEAPEAARRAAGLLLLWTPQLALATLLYAFRLR